jgi:hypothetical protein
MRIPILVSLLSVSALALAGLTIVSAAPVSLGQTLTGGGTSNWNVTNDGGTGNGLPAGDSCEGDPGLTIQDANIPDGGDAYDNAAMLWLDSTVFVPPDPVDLTGQTLTAGPVSMSGLDVTMQYYAASGDATLRTLITFQNPSGSAINATAEWVNNHGSDGGTGIRGTSDGDLTFSTADRWIVSSDSAGTPGDPVNTYVLFGPGSPAATPSAASQLVFSCAGTEGVLSTFDISVPAGATRHLMFFNQMNAENAEGLAGAVEFDTNPAQGGDLLSGLDATQLSEVLNWAFGAPPIDTPTEPGTTPVPTTEPLSDPPTAVEGPIAAPDTGTSDSSGSGAAVWIALVGLVALATLGGALAVRYARR